MKVKGYAIGLILLLSLLGSVTLTAPGIADSDTVKWFPVNIPTEGKPGDWVLAKGSDIQHLARTADGTLYGYANPSGTSYTLFQSTDGGGSWSFTGKVKDTIVDIATLPGDAGTIYYATLSDVYRSTDAGISFASLAGNPGGAGSDNVEIISLDVVLRGGDDIIVVGTRDTDNAQYGGVYIWDEGQRFPVWSDASVGDYDVYAVAFSPNFASDQQLVAVVTDETDTLVTTKMGSAGWGATVGNARLDQDNSGTPTPVAVNMSADIVFPDDYSSDISPDANVWFIAIATGSSQGDVYRIYGVAAPDSSVATDLNIGAAYELSNVGVTGLAISGDATTATLLAGAAASARVYLSTDGGTTWSRSRKPPTGETRTYVIMAPDFGRRGRAYVATSGSESAFSITTDGGATWNQLGLIDSRITDLVDLALSPDYSQDETMFLLTYGGEHSLWRTGRGGKSWERVFTSAAADVDSIDRVELSPRYGDGSQVVFIAGTSPAGPAIWASTDNGQRFSRPRTTRDSTTGATFNIDTWAVADDNTLFIGSYDGSNGLVYGTTNGGLSYAGRAVAGSQSLSSITLSPDQGPDETILVGNTDGWVYWSDNNGISFEPLPAGASSAPLTGTISVAFGSRFGSNQTVYAASDTADKGIYRLSIDAGTGWESIDSTLPGSGRVSELMVAADGVLYATNLTADGGMERSLNPTYNLGPAFESVTRGLDDGATLVGLWRHGNRLWAIDTTNTRLMTFTDSLTGPVILTSPVNQAAGIGTIVDYTVRNALLDWEGLPGATQYKWQLDYDTDFSSVPSGFEGTTEASSVRLPTLEPATTYYWKVRATRPVLSPWSAKWSFATSLGTEVIAPQLISPPAGAREASTRPVFQWSAIAGADSYELMVSTDPALGNPTILKIGAYALLATVWEANVTLDNETTYYWRVRAMGSNTSSDWSSVSSFTTGSPPLPKEAPAFVPAPAPAPPPPAPPPPPAQPATPDWLIYLVGPLILTIVLLLVTILVLVLRRR